MKLRTRKLLTLLLIAAMVMSLMVPALAADTAQSETPYTYDAGDYTFGKISHPNSAPGQPDGLVDYTGNGTVAVTGTADGADASRRHRAYACRYRHANTRLQPPDSSTNTLRGLSHPAANEPTDQAR